jgi:hypothetical protein
MESIFKPIENDAGFVTRTLATVASSAVQGAINLLALATQKPGLGTALRAGYGGLTTAKKLQNPMPAFKAIISSPEFVTGLRGGGWGELTEKKAWKSFWKSITGDVPSGSDFEKILQGFAKQYVVNAQSKDSQ